SDQRQQMEYPLDKLGALWAANAPGADAPRKVSLPDQPADFLFEIGVEELPPGDVDSALDQLQLLANKLFSDLRLSHGELKIYATPRRLVVSARALAAHQTDLEQVAKGPSADRAFDAEGKPTKAAEGFARGKGINVEDLRVEDGYVVASVRETGRPASELLAQALPGLVAALKFPKTMRWNASNIAFSRPIRWFVALHGGAVVPISYAGIISGDTTRGLRPFDSPLHPITSADDYFTTLDAEGILLDIDWRRQVITEQVEAIATKVGGRILDDARLLDEVTNLVERPTALLGRFEEKYLKLPREVLVTVMRDKQRYFAIEDKSGRLLPYFIAVRNGDAEHLDKVTHGNEEVLRARFSDADFFYAQDIKKPLADFMPRLGTLTFHEKLGSMLDKNNRLVALVEPLGKLLALDAKDIAVAGKAAALAKADLATQMVVEMTSLQGTMGRVYALRDGQPQPVADAIYEHWLPRNSGDGLPASLAGTLLALADRLDSLVGLFAAGLEPKSTTDPYGLRRAALGIIEILVEKELDLDLRQAIQVTAAAQPIPVSAEVQASLLDFIAGRLRGWVEDHGWAHDISAAVLAAQSANPARALTGIRQLSEWVKRPDWEALLDGFARCVRITRAEKETYPVDPALFQQPEENALYMAFAQAEVHLKSGENVDGFLNAFAPMLPAISAYFGTGKNDGVLVNTEDQAVRRNRIGQLQAISAMQHGRADLSYLSGF
ncbi:MAG: glycine--tRNA ligase subunit beta, partial [Chloroflexota bacterium]